MTLVVDIDDTLLKTDGWMYEYRNPVPIQKEIDLVNKAYEDGHTLILHTARNWDKYDLTIKHVQQLNIKYHQLVMGKPQGDYIDSTHNYRSMQEWYTQH